MEAIAHRPAVLLRPAREDELERLITIHVSAFPDARGREARRRNFLENPRGGFEDLFVAELAGQPVGHAFLFRMLTWMGGREVPISGVASVAVAPEARGQGVGHAIMRGVLSETRSRGQVASILYPFKHAFYRRFGYALAGEVRRLRVPAAAFPACRDALTPRPLRPEDLLALRRCYQRVAMRGNGLVSRRERYWRMLLGVESRQGVVVPSERDPNEVSGYLLYAYASSPGAPAVDIDVQELVADSDVARRTLYAFLRSQRDQVACVRHVIDPREPLLASLDEPRTPGVEGIRSLVAVVGDLGAGHMMRVVDVPGALAARGWSADGQVAVRIADPLSAGGRIALGLSVKDGAASVVADRGGPALACDVGTFAQLFCGYLLPSDAVRLGLATVDSPRTAGLCDALFRLPPPFLIDVF